MPRPSSFLGRAALLGAALFLSASSALRADFTENMIARWTFNQPGPRGLIDDVKGIRLDTAALPSAAGRPTPRPADGLLKVELGHYLFALGLAAEHAPALRQSVTLWARLRIDGGDTDRTGFLFGLMQSPKPGDWADASLVLMHRPPGLDRAVGFSGFANVAPGSDFGFGDNSLPDTPGRFLNIAVVFDGRAESVTLHVDGTMKTVRKRAARELMPAAALMLGQLKAAGGADLTFDEVRVYRGALAPEWLGDITPVPNPGPAQR